MTLRSSEARSTTVARIDPRTRALLEGPIAATLLRLAAPNILVMLVQASVGLIETYFIGWLGTDALAGVALVFPVVMLMQMMSAGAMGGGISSAVARALGAGRRDRRRRAGAACAGHRRGRSASSSCSRCSGGGRWLYARDGRQRALRSRRRSTYSNVVFAGAVLVWIFNSLANVIRGTGNMVVPAIVTCAGAVVLIPLSPCLIFGLGPFPRLGIAGGAVAVVAYYAVGSLALAALSAGRAMVARPASPSAASASAGRCSATSCASAWSPR